MRRRTGPKAKRRIPLSSSSSSPSSKKNSSSFLSSSSSAAAAAAAATSPLNQARYDPHDPPPPHDQPQPATGVELESSYYYDNDGAADDPSSLSSIHHDNAMSTMKAIRMRSTTTAGSSTLSSSSPSQRTRRVRQQQQHHHHQEPYYDDDEDDEHMPKDHDDDNDDDDDDDDKEKKYDRQESKKLDSIHLYWSGIGLILLSLWYLLIYGGRKTAQLLSVAEIRSLMNDDTLARPVLPPPPQRASSLRSVVVVGRQNNNNNNKKDDTKNKQSSNRHHQEDARSNTKPTDYVVFVSRSNGHDVSAVTAMGRSSKSATAALRNAQSQLPHFTHNYEWVKIDLVTAVHSYSDLFPTRTKNNKRNQQNSRRRRRRLDEDVHHYHDSEEEEDEEMDHEPEVLEGHDRNNIEPGDDDGDDDNNDADDYHEEHHHDHHDDDEEEEEEVLSASSSSSSSVSAKTTRWFGIAMNDWQVAWLPDEVYAKGLLGSSSSISGSKFELRWDHVARDLLETKTFGTNQGDGGEGTSTTTTTTTTTTGIASWPGPEPIFYTSDEEKKMKHHRRNTLPPGLQIEFFETKAVFCDFGQLEPIGLDLYHGHRMISASTILSSSTYLRQASIAAGQYLMRQIKTRPTSSTLWTSSSSSSSSSNTIEGQEGRMVYHYMARSDQEDNASYSYTRHAGTIYSMALLYKFWAKEELGVAVRKGLDHIVSKRIQSDCPLAYDHGGNNNNHNNMDSGGGSSSTNHHRHGRTTKCVLDSRRHGDRWTHLGLNSLTLLAMVQYQESFQDDQRYLDVAMSIATWIISTQRSDGSFVQRQNLDQNELDEESYVLYFPGEACFALSKLVNVNVHNPNIPAAHLEEWKRVAAAGMDFVVQREGTKPDADFVNDHWMMYAMAEMYPWHWTLGMMEFAQRTVRIAHERQVTDDPTKLHPDQLDEFGVYKKKKKTKKKKATGGGGPEETTTTTTTSLSSCATGTKNEGLCAILPILVEQEAKDLESRQAGRDGQDEGHGDDLGRPVFASMSSSSNFVDWAWQAIQLGIRYSLQAQFTPEVAMYMKHPGRVVGAISWTIRQRETRNDFVQHNLSAFLCLMNHLEKGTMANRRRIPYQPEGAAS